jgi:hypothetical protein
MPASGPVTWTSPSLARYSAARRGTSTHMATSLFGQLDRSLHDRLGELVQQARHGDDDTALDLARVELPKVVTALRALLGEHHPDERGRCATCRSRRLRRRLPSPCRAYLTANLCLMIADEAGPTPRRHLHRAS